MQRRSASTARSGWRLSDGLQLPRIKPGAFDVPGRDAEEPFALLGLQFTHDLSWRADDQHAVGDFFPLGDERIGADQNALADLRAIQHHAIDADQRALADGAAVEHYLVADAHAAPERHRVAGVDVQHGRVLHVAALADGAAIVLGPDHHLEPDVHVGVQRDRADEGCVVRDVMTVADELDATLAEGEERHAAIIVACARANPSISTSAACAITCGIGRRRTRRRSCCCTAGWMSRHRSSFWSTPCAASGIFTRPTGAATA